MPTSSCPIFSVSPSSAVIWWRYDRSYNNGFFSWWNHSKIIIDAFFTYKQSKLFFLATVEAVEHRGGDEPGSFVPGPQQNLQTQAGNISWPYTQGELLKKSLFFLLLLFEPHHWCLKPHKFQPLTCPVSMVFSFLLAANVHFLCPKLQVHFSQRAAHDQLYAANSDRDVLPWHTSHIQASLHLHPTDGHPPQERYDHEEEGWFLTVCSGSWSETLRHRYHFNYQDPGC